MSGILDKSVQYLKGVGEARAKDFARLGVCTLRDLVFTFPRDISDRSNISTIAGIENEGEVVILGNVIKYRERNIRRGKLRCVVTAIIDDGTGHLEASWFNAPWIAEKLNDATLLLYGKVRRDGKALKMDHPVFEVVPDSGDISDSLTAGRMVPIYPCTGKLNQNVWRKVIDAALNEAKDVIPEIYPPDYLREHQLLDRASAVCNMHFPEDEETRMMARYRLAYDECIMMQLAIAMRRKNYHDSFPGRSFNYNRSIDTRIRRLFPFRLTDSQERVIREVVEDMQKPDPMHRLIQGDVGSGKTAVAFYAILVAVANKTQVCFMAPTALLATQHFNTITSFLAASDKSRVQMRLLSSGMKKSERELLKAELASGAIDILISTHAAIQTDVEFADLGLVIIDEQHKFGVNQRGALINKGVRPDTIVMTATPIPRSLALTLYGDLDVSVIDSLPPGRKPVKSSLMPLSAQAKVWSFVRKELAKGAQAYVVSPLLEENEEISLISAKEAFEQLKNEEFKGYSVGLMSGKMSKDEQHQVMTKFRNQEVDLLVSTVVIEVGVDVPNANIMVIIHAERFGLAQLHQLRGRVGRGSEQGYFVLLAGGNCGVSRERLEILVSTNDGFDIAEQDLRLRGPGEFLGTRQHGLPELKLVDIVNDFDMIKHAQKEVAAMLPDIKSPRFSALLSELVYFMRGIDAAVSG